MILHSPHHTFREVPTRQSCGPAFCSCIPWPHSSPCTTPLGCARTPRTSSGLGSLLITFPVAWSSDRHVAQSKRQRCCSFNRPSCALLWRCAMRVAGCTFAWVCRPRLPGHSNAIRCVPELPAVQLSVPPGPFPPTPSPPSVLESGWEVLDRRGPGTPPTPSSWPKTPPPDPAPLPPPPPPRA